MPEAKPGRTGLQTLAILFVLGAAVLLGGPAAALTMLLFAWPIAALLAADAFSHGAAALLIIGGCSLSRVPAVLILACCVPGFIGLTLDRYMKLPFLRGALWGLLSLVTLCLWGLSFRPAIPGSLSETLARSIAEGIGARPDADSVLLQLAQTGYFNLAGLVPADGAMTAALRTEMLRTLTSYAETVLGTLLPQLTGVFPVACAWLCLVPPSVRCRRCGETAHTLPRAEHWHIPRVWNGTMVALWVTALLLMTGTGLWESLGLTLTGFVEALLAVRGCCGLLARWKQRGVSRGLRSAGVTLLVLAAPVVPVVIGIIDQLKRPRGPHSPEGGPKEREEPK